MYFRKVIGVKLRSIRKATVLQGRAIVHDFFAYLVDSQHLEEALSVSQVGPPSSPPPPPTCSYVPVPSGLTARGGNEMLIFRCIREARTWVYTSLY